ncbi:MAG: hypothetical protein E7643_01490 [Ruminococcaceae bacterium]|nr:hypothetical protein [Oscillospiraceae bacterium]
MNERERELERVTELWRMFRRGREYQSSKGLSRILPLCVRFYEGDQWAPPTKNTRNLPRPVVNFTKMICRSKKSAILSTPQRILYRSYDSAVDTARLNSFAEYIQKELGQDELDRRGIDCAVKKGTYIYHYYWDKDARGLKGRAGGALRGELLEPLNVFFSDPTETDEQKQAWILIATRESVETVRSMCRQQSERDAVTADSFSDPYGHTEAEGEGLVTVLTRYFRRNGEVFAERATKSVCLGEPFPITPDPVRFRRSLDKEDPARAALPEEAEGKKEEAKARRTRATLYPVVVGSYESREGCIYGLGEVEGIIPNQRAVNFNLAMMLLSAQENGWGKYVVQKDALRGQVITNEPGQVLTDHTPGGGGIRRLSDHSLPAAPMQIVEALTQLTRTVTGASEVMTGEVLSSGMSGAAIAQLQSQALQPVEELRRAFCKVKEKQGEVLAQFFRLYYTDTPYPAGEGGDTYRYDVFDSAPFREAELEVTVEAVGGTNSSAAGDISALDVALKSGAISLTTYFELYPKDALSNRREIIAAIEREKAVQKNVEIPYGGLS